jgi:hypothetical protein
MPKAYTSRLLGIESDPKTIKGTSQGVLTGILYLAPARLSGWNTCAQASAGCIAACLNKAGRGGLFSNVQEARIAKTRVYYTDRDGFMAQLVAEIAALSRKATKRGLRAAVRLNGTSDIPWERIPVAGHANIMAAFPDVTFYDYTKITKRALSWARGDMPTNYHLTFSRTESNHADALAVLAAGGNVAAVFRKALPEAWAGVSVINGDETDLRFTDPKGVVVGLKAKGPAKRDQSGFVLDVA